MGVLFTFLMLGFVNFAVAAEPSPQEIIEKAKDAMNVAMEYQVNAADGAATTVVYQKTLTNGTIASRSETSSGVTKIIYLFSNGKSYQLFPDVHAAIDMSYLKQVVGQEQSVNPFAQVILGTAEWKGFTTYSGKTCYQIQAHMAPMDASLIATLRAKFKQIIPDGCLYLIETNTYRVLQMTMLHGESTYAKIEFKDFDVLSDLSDDFFIVPQDYKIEKPDSLEQAVKITEKYIALEHKPKNIPKGFAFDPDTLRIVKVDPKTGAFIPLTRIDHAEKATSPAIRIITLLMLVVSSVVFLIFIIANQCGKKKSD